MSGFLVVKAVTNYSFPATQGFSITAQYGFGGPSPNFASLIPGNTLEFTLSVQNVGQTASNVAIYFQASNPSDWTIPGYSSQQQGCGTTTNGYFRAIVNGVTIAPGNATIPSQGICSVPSGWPASVQATTISATPGSNTIHGQIIVANNTPLTYPGFSLNWFATPQ